MNGRALGAFAGALALLFCACATTLRGTDVSHQRISPERARLVWTWSPGPSKDAPVLSTTLATEYLSERVETKRYHTDYSWANRGCWFGATAALVGAAVKVRDWGQHYKGSDTVMGTSTALAILSAIPFLASFAFADFPLSSRNWSKNVVLQNDTSYQFATCCASAPVSVSVTGKADSRTLRTDGAGPLDVDIRDFYELAPVDSALRLTATWSGLSASLVVPRDYVGAVRQAELNADALRARAIKAEGENRVETAITLYDTLASSFAETKSAAVASGKLAELQEKLREARLAQARRDLGLVSSDKVQSAIGRMNLTEGESNTLAQSVEYLPQGYATRVMKDGCCFPLTDDECAAEYRRLTRFQKFYALLSYKEHLGSDARPTLTAMLNMGTSVSDRLISIDPRALLR